jgi:hypothetical protein
MCRNTEVQDEGLSPVWDMRARPWVLAPVQDVQNLFPVAQPEGGDPRRQESELVAPGLPVAERSAAMIDRK